MSSRVDPPKHHEPDRRPPAGRLDKAFPVFLEGERGVAAGIGRLGSRVRVTFTSPSGGAEMVLEGEVRYQCFINFTRADAVRAGMRGIGLKFVTPKGAQGLSRGTIH